MANMTETKTTPNKCPPLVQALDKFDSNRKWPHCQNEHVKMPPTCIAPENFHSNER